MFSSFFNEMKSVCGFGLVAPKTEGKEQGEGGTLRNGVMTKIMLIFEPFS